MLQEIAKKGDFSLLELKHKSLKCIVWLLSPKLLNHNMYNYSSLNENRPLSFSEIFLWTTQS